MDWKDISEYPNYEVSSSGIIRNKKTKRHLRQQVRNSGGYLSVTLYHNGRGKSHYVHRVVALAHLAGHFLFAQVNHKDSNTHNNCVNNLEWCTPQENTDHKVASNRAIGNRVYSELTYEKIRGA